MLGKKYLVVLSLLFIIDQPQAMDESGITNTTGKSLRLYVGIRLKDMDISNSLSEGKDLSWPALKYKFEHSDLNKPYIPTPHITLYNGRISESDAKAYATDLDELGKEIRDALGKFDHETRILKTQISGLWAGFNKKDTSPYNIVLPLTQTENQFIRMAHTVRNIIEDSEVGRYISPVKYRSYEETLDEWKTIYPHSVFQCAADIHKTDEYDESAGFLHTTLLTAYNTNQTSPSLLNNFESALKSNISLGAGKIKSIIESREDIDEKQKRIILSSIFDTVLEINDDDVLTRDHDTYKFDPSNLANELTKKLNDQNIILPKDAPAGKLIGTFMSTIKGTLVRKTEDYSVGERLGFLRKALTNYQSENPQVFPSTSGKEEVTDDLIITNVDAQLDEEGRRYQNYMADELCNSLRKDDGAVVDASFSWDSFDLNGFDSPAD